MTRLRVAIFPGAGSVHLYHGVDAGLFEASGLEVVLHEVTSSDEQIGGWDAGRFELMHTSPDHLLRGGRSRDPVIVRAEGIGELSVYRRPDLRNEDARWAVDGPASAFALVLRTVLVDVAGVTVQDEQLLPIGGTKQRADALLAGGADGAILHPPFDRLAAAAGFERIGGHLDVLPDLLTVCAVAPRANARSEAVRAYVQVCDASATALVAGGAAAVSAALVRRGWDERLAAGAAQDVLGPGGLAYDSRPALEALEATVSLRRRWFPEWTPTVSVSRLIEPQPS